MARFSTRAVGGGVQSTRASVSSKIYLASAHLPTTSLFYNLLLVVLAVVSGRTQTICGFDPYTGIVFVVTPVTTRVSCST